MWFTNSRVQVVLPAMSVRPPDTYAHVREHLETDRASHIFKHLEGSKECRSACFLDSFATIDQASSRFALKIKEALHILWEKPTLNAQVKHVNLKLSV